MEVERQTAVETLMKKGLRERYNPEFDLQIGHMYYMTNDLKNAKAFYEAALQKDRVNHEAKERLAEVSFLLEEYGEDSLPGTSY